MIREPLWQQQDVSLLEKNQFRKVLPKKKQRFLLICERDVGLFSLIQQVIANIPRALAEDRIPIVLFGASCSYYIPEGFQDRDTVWEYFFEPVDAATPAASIPTDIVARIPETRLLEMGIGHQIDNSYYASAHFGDHPDLAGKTLTIPWEWDDPTTTLRRTTAPIVDQYIRPRAYLTEKVERFYAEHLAGKPLIGVQIRGTDAVSQAETRAFRSGSLRPHAYIAAVERLLTKMPNARIFVATDAESSLAFMKEHFGNRVVAYDSLRQQSEKSAGRGPQGCLMPAYIAGKPDAAARNGEEAILEYLLLCRSDVLVHNGSSLARTVLLTCPELPHIRTNPPRRLRGHLHQFYRKFQRLLFGDGIQQSQQDGSSNPSATRMAHWRVTLKNLFETLRDPNRSFGAVIHNDIAYIRQVWLFWRWRFDGFFEPRRDPDRLWVGLILWCTDHLRRILLRDPYVLVLARQNNAYLKKRRKQQKDIKPTVLEIRNDFDCNAGFCVQIQFVLAQLKAREARSSNLQPVVNLDQTFGFYYDPSYGTNIWEYYFEPVAEMSSDELENLPPELLTRYDPIDQGGLCLGEDGHPQIASLETVQWYAMRRKEGVELVRKYVRVKPHVTSKVDDFYEREMKDTPVLGVHIRGTDKGFDRNGRLYGFPDYLARIVPPEEYWAIADEFIEAYPDCKIFVATDQQQSLEAFRHRYPNRVLAYGDTRSTTTQNSMHVQDGKNYQKGEDVLIDCLLLSRTDFLLRCQSNVGEVAAYFNPNLPVIDMQYSRTLQNVPLKINKKNFTAPTQAQFPLSSEDLLTEGLGQGKYSGTFQKHIKRLQWAHAIETIPYPARPNPVAKKINEIGNAVIHQVLCLYSGSFQKPLKRFQGVAAAKIIPHPVMPNLIAQKFHGTATALNHQFQRLYSNRFRRHLEKLAPRIPDQFFPSREDLRVENTSQREYSNTFQSHLEWLQSSAVVTQAPVSLTYLPIAKNIRWIGTALYRNVQRHQRTILTEGNPYEEKQFRKNGRPAWRPWLWSRIPRTQLPNVAQGVDNPDLAWPTYFQELSHPTSSNLPKQCLHRTWGRSTKERVLRMAACTNFAFRLNEYMAGVLDDWKVRIGWDDSEPKIGIHLRRGDAASEDLSKQTRPSYHLEHYLQHADTMCQQYNIQTIYLSTESESEIEQAQKLRPQYRVISLNHDREIFPRIADSSIFIEDLAFSDHSVIEPLVNSAIADLWFLQHCSTFIGTFNSEFSMLAWLLCIGHHGCVIPYVNLSPASGLKYYQGVLGFSP